MNEIIYAKSLDDRYFMQAGHSRLLLE